MIIRKWKVFNRPLTFLFMLKEHSYMPWFSLQFQNIDKMKDLDLLMTEISKLTADIENNYPELYRFLDENPMTIPAMADPNINKEIMRDYLNSLKELLRQHIEKHTENSKR